MSKYTTEVRFICEEAAGLDSSVGYNDAEQVVQTAYPKIFSSSLVFYDEETKSRLLPKILLHYYQREIGFETVGLWKLKLNQKLREILPYYNQLYASEALVYDPLKNVDNIHTHSGGYLNSKGGNNKTIEDKTETRDLTETKNLQTVDDGSSSYDRNEDTILRHDKTTTHENDKTQRENDTTIRGNDTTSQLQDSNTHTIESDAESWVLFSDTPQGGINGVQNAGGTSQSGTLSDNAYLTNATHTTEKPAATKDITQHGTITNTHGNVTNVFGDVTQEYGDITETYNKSGDKKDHVDSDGWDKFDNTNTQTGTVQNTGTIKNTGTTTNTKDEQDTGTDEYKNTETGKIGVMTYQEMQMKWRESFLNIDMQIINELGDLFMKVW